MPYTIRTRLGVELPAVLLDGFGGEQGYEIVSAGSGGGTQRFHTGLQYLLIASWSVILVLQADSHDVHRILAMADLLDLGDVGLLPTSSPSRRF